MSREWWDGLLPVEVRLDCSGGTHTVRWEDGVVNAVDHEDPVGERALAALGGERSTCIELLDSWARHADDLRVLTIASRGASDPVRPDAESRFLWPTPGLMPARGRGVAMRAAPPGSAGWAAYAPLSGGQMVSGGQLVHRGQMGRGRPGPRSDEVVDLIGLGGALTQRLVAEILATWSARLVADEGVAAPHLPALTASLYGRVVVSVRSWLGDAGTHVELDMIAPSESPSMARRDGVVHARLPFAWLSDIWVKDLAVVLGRFALCTVESGSGRLRLSTVDPHCTDVRPVTVSLD